MQLASAFADVSLAQLALVAGVALFAAIVGGIAGYGTGALMPLVLVPLIGAEPVVPIIAISALLTNASRAAAFRAFIDARRALIVLAAAIPLCIVSAYGYTLLDSRGALIVIGAMLILTCRCAVFCTAAIFGCVSAVSRSARLAGARWSAARPAPASSCCPC